MKIELVAIGSEVLAGRTVNGNAAFISRELERHGFPITSHRVIGDGAVEIEETLRDSVAKNDIVICTGGLGPTRDDITRAAIARVTECDVSFRQEVVDRLVERFGKEHPTFEDQATIPDAAMPLHNSVGTAPGLLFSLPQSILIALPGVPVEMEALLTEQVIPYLSRSFTPQVPLAIRRLHFFGVPEAELDKLAAPLLDAHPDVTYGIYPSQGVVLIHLAGEEERELEEIANAIEAAHPHNLFPSRYAHLEEAVHAICTEKKLTVACAESCTGGALAAKLTHLPGASKYFLGSIVSYSNELKMKHLGVKQETLDQYGAVSEQTAQEMVAGLDADLTISITGIAGPDGGTEEKPVGTVYFAAQRRGEAPVLSKILARGNRASIIQRSINHALAQLWKLATAS